MEEPVVVYEKGRGYFVTFDGDTAPIEVDELRVDNLFIAALRPGKDGDRYGDKRSIAIALAYADRSDRQE